MAKINKEWLREKEKEKEKRTKEEINQYMKIKRIKELEEDENTQ
jgi:hypothetical protein